MHIFTEKIWEKENHPKSSKQQKFMMAGRWGMVIKKNKQTWAGPHTPPLKLTAGTWKSPTSFENGSIIWTKPSWHLGSPNEALLFRIRVHVPVGHLRFDVLLSWERTKISPLKGTQKSRWFSELPLWWDMWSFLECIYSISSHLECHGWMMLAIS